eukprot:scpid84513/ scgid32369/ 
MKSMINALHSSSSNGTKAFVTPGGTPFGWQTIKDMYSRECKRQEAGIPRDVPGLRKNFVVRDSWTKLNVHPAKIMQQRKVISEISVYIDSKPQDGINAAATVQYLRACSNLFENGTLSHEKVRSADSQPIARIKEGYSFFESWLDGLLLADSH